MKLKSYIQTNIQSGKNARRPVWTDKELLAKFKHKMEGLQRVGNLGGIE